MADEPGGASANANTAGGEASGDGPATANDSPSASASDVAAVGGAVTTPSAAGNVPRVASSSALSHGRSGGDGDSANAPPASSLSLRLGRPAGGRTFVGSLLPPPSWSPPEEHTPPLAAGTTGPAQARPPLAPLSTCSALAHQNFGASSSTGIGTSTISPLAASPPTLSNPSVGSSGHAQLPHVSPPHTQTQTPPGVDAANRGQAQRLPVPTGVVARGVATIPGTGSSAGSSVQFPSIPRLPPLPTRDPNTATPDENRSLPPDLPPPLSFDSKPRNGAASTPPGSGSEEKPTDMYGYGMNNAANTNTQHLTLLESIQRGLMNAAPFAQLPGAFGASVAAYGANAEAAALNAEWDSVFRACDAAAHADAQTSSAAAVAAAANAQLPAVAGTYVGGAGRGIPSLRFPEPTGPGGIPDNPEMPPLSPMSTCDDGDREMSDDDSSNENMGYDENADPGEAKSAPPGQWNPLPLGTHIPRTPPVLSSFHYAALFAAVNAQHFAFAGVPPGLRRGGGGAGGTSPNSKDHHDASGSAGDANDQGGDSAEDANDQGGDSTDDAASGGQGNENAAKGKDAVQNEQKEEKEEKEEKFHPKDEVADIRTDEKELIERRNAALRKADAEKCMRILIDVPGWWKFAKKPWVFVCGVLCAIIVVTYS